MNKRYIRTIVLTLALIIGAAHEAWAMGNNDIIFDPANPEGGTVSLKSISNSI